MNRVPSQTRGVPAPSGPDRAPGGAGTRPPARRPRRRSAVHTALVSGLAAVMGCAGLATVTEALAATPAGAVSPLTPGDLIVYRVGTGTGTLGSASSAVFLDEYSPAGALIESIPMPTAASGGNNPLTASGSATSEGQLTLSADGSSVVATGYGTGTGTASVSGTASTSVHRTVAVVSSAGAVNTTTALSDFASANNPRGVASTDGTHLWVSGADGSSGARYTTVGATTSTALVSSTYKNLRTVQVVGGQLYASADPTKAAVTVASVGSGAPTSGTNPVTNLPFSSAPTSPFAFSFLTLGSGTAPDTVYVADNGAGTVSKYGLSGGTWVKDGTVNVPNVLGVSANDVAGTVTIFATASTGTDGQLYSITDASGAGGTLTGSPTNIASAPSSEAFRGVAFAPGTTIGSGGGTPPPTPPSLVTADSSLEGTLQDPSNPTLGLTVGDVNYTADQLNVTASSSNPAVAAATTVTGTGASRTLSVTPGTTVGYSTITLTVTAPDSTTTTTTVTYGLSAYQGDATQRYITGDGNASSAVDVGGGYMLVADDLSNVIHLYQEGVSGGPVKSFDFTGVLPYGTTTMDLEAAARSGNTIYWLGSQSSSDSGNPRPAANTLFATTVAGSGPSTSLTYVGSYTGLRQDLINWDVAQGNPLNLSVDSQGGSKTVDGFNIEGLEFAPGSSSTAYLAFRAPLENSSNPTDALLVPVTDLDALVANGNPGTTAATFGPPIEWNLGGLGIREIRKNADNQYLVIAGTADGTDSPFGLYEWDGNPSDAPVESPTSAGIVPEAGGAWESIVSVPDPLVSGSPVTLLEDNGDSAWYGGTATSKAGLPTGLQKDLEQTFTYAVASTVPGAPTGATAAAATDGSGTISVSWTAPTDDGGATISGYTVTVTPVGGGTPVSQAFGGAATSGTVTGLVNGTAYTVTVTATNSVGTGSSATAGGGPFTPSGAPDAPTGVEATAGNGVATVSWTAPSDEGSPITGYTVTSSGGQTCATPDGSTTTCDVTGLTNGVAYTFTVTATNADGTSVASASSAAVVPTTTPDAPTGVVATAGDGAATVSWTAPSDEGSPITGYTVTSSGGQTCTSATTSCTVTGLQDGTSYTFTVTATNALGTGLASAPSTPVTPSTVPDAPTGVVATAGNGSATVSWTAAGAEGSPVTGYTVTASNSNPPFTCSTTGATSCTVTGLVNGAVYTFSVTATNANGRSSSSAPSAAVSPTSNTAVITSASSLTVASGKSVHFKLTASGTPSASFTAVGLPNGMTLTSGGGKGVLQGAPVAGDGTYTFTLVADNGTGPGYHQTFTLTVFGFTTGTSASFTVGSHGSFAVATAPASVGTSLTAKVPAKLRGLTFVAGPNGTGTLSGTPATGAKSGVVTITASTGSFTLQQQVAVSVTG